MTAPQPGTADSQAASLAAQAGVEPDRQRFDALTIDMLADKLAGHLSVGDIALVRKAYDFALASHEGQTRVSGDPYITHPLATAFLLSDFRLDAAVFVAALLHDVLEDTTATKEHLRFQFGDEVAELVDGVTKLSRLHWSILQGGKKATAKPSEGEINAWAENLRKMFLAIAEDIRVVLIKLADRLHNMRTLGYLPPEKRREVAQETLEIYAPLASRLGMWQAKWQLEDLAFRNLEPAKYREVAAMLASRRESREEYIGQVIAVLSKELSQAGIEAEISGRAKHIYSIYRKMQRRGMDFAQIHDLLAVRVLVNEVADCYSALGAVHALWHPLPGQFDDYIAMPKESLYQSLHTTVIGPNGQPLEIQIRTLEMHRLAEYGLAAHWRYKEGVKRDVRFEEKVAWLRQLIDWQKEVAGGAQEFVESLKADVFQDQVYVFTPKGAIKELPSGATPVDFAYRIHTDVGHRCIGAKVNGRLMPLDYHLKTGDVIEIVTTKAQKGPSRDWLNPNLNYVRTMHARDKIRQWFKRQERDENVARGREMLDRELQRLRLVQENLEQIARQFKYDKVDDFLAAIGYGELNAHHVALRLASPTPTALDALESLPTEPPAERIVPAGITVTGVGDLLTRLGRCCNPVPGDRIVGYITRGKGITIHRQDCSNVRSDNERLVPVDWGRGGSSAYPVPIRIEAWDRDGLLRDIAEVVAGEKINLSAVSAVTHKDGTATIRATLEIPSVERLSRTLGRIEGVRDVLAVTRDTS